MKSLPCSANLLPLFPHRLCREEMEMLDMQAFYRNLDLPMFKLKGVTFKYCVMEEKTNL
jgi:hypothetical protein